MNHDFGDDSSVQRYDSNGKSCTGIGGVMVSTSNIFIDYCFKKLDCFAAVNIGIG
jgi:hypothetical protein